MPIANRFLMAKPDPLKQEFTELDQEREASMADEGGFSGAEMEKEDENPEPLIAVPHFNRRSESPVTLKDVALFVALIAASGFYLADVLRKRRPLK